MQTFSFKTKILISLEGFMRKMIRGEYKVGAGGMSPGAKIRNQILLSVMSRRLQDFSFKQAALTGMSQD